MPRPIVIDAMISHNPFSAMQYLEGIAEYGQLFSGFRVAACLSGGPAHILQRLKRSKANAILARADSNEVVQQIADIGKPAVNLDFADSAAIMPTVSCDDVAVGRIAAEHLLERGYRNLAYFGPSFSVSDRREAGFCQAATKGKAREVYPLRDLRGRPIDWKHMEDPALMMHWLQRLPRPLGLMTFNDQFSVEALEVCEELGLHVPDDVAIVGVDNTPLRCTFAGTTLSSVDLGANRIGYAAAEILHNLASGIQPAQRLLELPPEGVVARRSTDAMAFEDSDVGLAMRFIKDRFCDGITVEDLVRHVSVSRSSLERKFRQTIGRPPGEEIHRRRLHRACHLLETTSIDLADIAAACGFNYLSNFSASFKSAMGMAPSDYRRQKQLTRSVRTGNQKRP